VLLQFAANDRAAPSTYEHAENDQPKGEQARHGTHYRPHVAMIAGARMLPEDGQK
jgi:hypothetical protein